MPAKFNLKTRAPQDHLHDLGQQLKQHRKANKLSAEAVAAAAGLSRTTLHRIESGEPSVAAGAYWAAVAALGLQCGLIRPTELHNKPLPSEIELAVYPQLKLLAWHVQGMQTVSPQEAWDIYTRNWRHLDEAALSKEESELIAQLRRHFEKAGRHV